MRVFFRLLSCVALVGLLAACSSQELSDKALDTEDVARARQVLTDIENKNFDVIEKQMDAEFKGPTLQTDLQNMVKLIPEGALQSTKAVGSQINTFNQTVTTYNITFEQQYAGGWMLAAVQHRKKDGEIKLIGIRFMPTKQPLEEANRFTFEGKSALHYIVLILALALPVFVLVMLVVCFRTPLAKRKWLWMIFIALGFTGFFLDWSTGAWSFRPLHVLLLSAGYMRAGPYAPYVLSVAIPVGAIMFLIRRPALMRKAAALQATNDSTPAVAPAPDVT